MSDVLIGEGVSDLFTLTLRGHEPGLPQRAEVLRHQRLRQPGLVGARADGERFAAQQPHQREAGFVAEDLEQLSGLVEPGDLVHASRTSDA